MEQRKRALLKFVGIFIGVIVVFYAIIAYTGAVILDPYINASAYLSALILSIFDKKIYSNAGTIISPMFTIVLSFGCDGSEPMAIFIAGVSAFPAKLKAKVKGLSIGLSVLYILNIIRIIALYFVGINLSEYFELCHTIVFPVVFILISVITWIYWIKSLGSKDVGKKIENQSRF